MRETRREPGAALRSIQQVAADALAHPGIDREKVLRYIVRRVEDATPEPGGEGDEVTTVARMIADAPMMGDKLALARRIVALASARPTPADVRERVVDEIVSTFRTLYPHARGSVAPAAYAAADRIIALLRTPRGEGGAVRRIATVALVLQRRGAPYDEVVSVGVWPEPGEFAALVKLTAGDFYDLAARRGEAQGEERAEDIARRIARDCRALHDRTPEEDATMRDALLDMAGGIEERLASIPGAARRREGDGVPILSAKNRNREEM